MLLPAFACIQVARGRLYSEMTSAFFSDTRNRSAEFFTISWWLGKGTLHWRRDK